MKHLRYATILLVAILTGQQVQAQWSLTGNGGTTWGTNYVGTSDNNGLTIRTNQSIRLRVNTGPLTSTINTFSVPTTGFLAAGPSSASGFWNAPANGPFSRLHLGEPTNNAQQWGYRPWQRNGIAITGNNDQMYVGHKYTYAVPTNYLSGEVPDYSDAVVQWSDNPGAHAHTLQRSTLWNSCYHAICLKA